MLNIRPDGTYVDLTFGGGGHSRHMLEQLGSKGRLFAFDQDEDAQRNVINDVRFTLIPYNFRYLKKYLRLYGVTQVDGVLGDLGVSSHQFDEAERGFSIRFEGELDMRMNRSNALTARSIVNEYAEDKLTMLFRNYAEVDNAKRVAWLIAEARKKAEIVTTADLRNAISGATPRHEQNRYLARIFQALRIEVNQEMEALKECLGQCPEILATGGRLVVISYHSLEDRMVKNMIRTGNVDGVETRDMVYGTTKKIFRNLTTRPVVPAEHEIEENPRARSAKMRAAEKIE